MNDRRPLLAILLIMVIAVVPGFFFKRARPPVEAPVPVGVDSTAAPAQPVGPALAPGDSGVQQAPPAASGGPADSTGASVAPIADDTVVVRSALYEYRFSTRGARLVSARFLRYRSMHPADTVGGDRDTLELVPARDPLLDNTLLVGSDTVRFAAAGFVPSASTVEVTAPSELSFTGTVGGRATTITYRFVPDDYHVAYRGRVEGIPVTGATLMVGMGNGFRDTESNIAENHRESGVVTKQADTDLTRYNKLDPLVPRVLPGPFEWMAVKSKYFVAALFAIDSTRPRGEQGGIGAVLTVASDTLPTRPIRARTAAAMTITSAGTWDAALFVGPMEYDRLTAFGHRFDDVNPYGWPGFRTVIRPFAVAVRTVFVWMHQSLGLHYGIALVVFGIAIRILLWPLNQKAMRSMTAMQAIQPQLQALQARHKEDPQRLQQEMLKLYREHKVNPFGGCWPMLIPYPFLIAVFFVLQNTIELRGVPFLWMPDLSRPDPLYIIPVFMALSMFGLSKIGQMGMPPNPQAKMMTYVMPVVLGVLFLNFASGLNLYYAVQNVAAVPQQWLIMRERRKLKLGTVATKKG